MNVSVYSLSVTVYSLSVTVYSLSVTIYSLSVTVYSLSVTVTNKSPRPINITKISTKVAYCHPIKYQIIFVSTFVYQMTTN